jgi:CheY-like chemotaxis protein
MAQGLTHAHQIVTASNGIEAIAVIKGGDRFDVILSDVMMPELDGVGLYIELLEIDPEQAQRIVLVSSGGDIAETLRLATDRPYLEKPFELTRARRRRAPTVGIDAESGTIPRRDRCRS